MNTKILIKQSSLQNKVHASHIKAVIFDMDGVISQTQTLQGEIESSLLKEMGIDISPKDVYSRYAGISDQDMFLDLFQKHNISQNKISDVINKKWMLMNEIPEAKIKPVTGAIELVDTLTNNGFLLAVASASKRSFIDRVLEKLNIIGHFSSVVSIEDVIHGKSSPDIFLLAAAKLKVDPEECIVIEDGESGMIGAKKAKMKCIGLVTNLNKDYPADKQVTSLNEITLDCLYSL